MSRAPRKLSEVQRAFQRYVLDGSAPEASGLFAPNGGAPLTTRMGIYHDAYRLRLIEALRSDYPALHHLLGAADFEAAARAYIDCHRSPYHNVRWYGGELADFLNTTIPWRKQPWIAEMARFEWSMLAAFDAAEAEVLTTEAMGRFAPAEWPALRFRAHPSVRLLALAFDTPALWKTHKAGGEVCGIEPAAPRCDWLIWRRQRETYFRSLPREENKALRFLLDGQSFAGICEQIDDADGNAALRAASFLKTWISEELLSAAAVTSV